MKIKFLISFVFITCLLTGCCEKKKAQQVTVAPADSGPTYGDTFVKSESADPDVINPLISRGVPAMNVESLIFNSLIKFDGDLNMVGDLADTWEVSTVNSVWYFHFDNMEPLDAESMLTSIKNQTPKVADAAFIDDFYTQKPSVMRVLLSEPQGNAEVFSPWFSNIKPLNSFAQTKIVFKLKKNVKWHDGAAFSSADVKFTYDKIVDKKIESISWRDPFLVIDEVTCPDNYSVEVTYKAPHFLALSCWSQSIVPEHILKNTNIEKSDFNFSPVGTGPFKLMKWQRQEIIHLRSNPDYFDGKPYLSGIIIRTIPDGSIRFQELIAGNIDLMAFNSDQYVKQKKDEEFLERFTLYNLALNDGFSYIGYNLDNPLFSDSRVRTAIAHAVDIDNIIHEILHDTGTRITGPFRATTWAYNPEVKPISFDPEKAKALLAEAGWTDSNGNGIVDKKGQEFTFSLLVSVGSSKLTAPFFVQSLKKIGIQVNIEFIEWVALLDKMKYRQFDTYIAGWALGITPDLNEIWHSSNIPSKSNGYYGKNYAGYINTEVDKLIEKSLYTIDIEERKKIFHRCHELIYKDQPYLFMYSANDKITVQKRFRNVEPKKSGIDYNIEKWWVPVSEQRYK